VSRTPPATRRRRCAATCSCRSTCSSPSSPSCALRARRAPAPGLARPQLRRVTAATCA
jgi:hypothetical protein